MVNCILGNSWQKRNPMVIFQRPPSRKWSRMICISILLLCITVYIYIHVFCTSDFHQWKGLHRFGSTKNDSHQSTLCSRDLELQQVVHLPTVFPSEKQAVEATNQFWQFQSILSVQVFQCQKLPVAISSWTVDLIGLNRLSVFVFRAFAFRVFVFRVIR